MKQTNVILLAEPEPEIARFFEIALRVHGYPVNVVRDGVEAVEFVRHRKEEVSAALLAAAMPRLDGMEALREIRALDPSIPVILYAGSPLPSTAAEARESGASGFLALPVAHGDLVRAVEAALGDAGPSFHAPEAAASAAVTCRNPQMQAIRAAVRRIALSDAPVIIGGESGAGKEVLARELHAASHRAAKPFLKLNCAAVPSELLESELFGYERGAFTGAFKSMRGKFELADGGTMMLDEIGDMDVRLQAKLLHVLQDREFQRLGGRDVISVDVRIIAATHRDLEKAIREGQFREDLFYRLNVINLTVPPLRDRQDEILPLARLFLQKHAVSGAGTPEIGPDLQRALLGYHWPGNIRELENTMRRLLVFGDPNVIARGLKRAPGKATEPEAQLPADLEESGGASSLAAVSQGWLRAEAKAIKQALEDSRWNRRRAAQALGIDYKALLYKMKKLGLETPAVITKTGDGRAGAARKASAAGCR